MYFKVDIFLSLLIFYTPGMWLLNKHNTCTKKWKNAHTQQANVTASEWDTLLLNVQNAQTLLLGIFAFNMVQNNES